MADQFPNNLPMLRSAMEKCSPLPGHGMCFHWSVALCLDLPGSEVVIGTFRAATPEERERIPNASDVPFIHAWVEWEGKVFAPTTLASTGYQFNAMPPEGYYEVNGAKNLRRVSRRTIRKHVADKAVLHQLLTGQQPKGQGYLVDRLMEAAGIKHAVVGGGVLPV